MGRVAKYSGGRKLGPLTLLGNDAPAVIKAAAQQLGDRSVKTRTGALQVLQELVAILPDSMQAHIAAVLPPLVAILNVGIVCIVAIMNHTALSYHGLSVASMRVWRYVEVFATQGQAGAWQGARIWNAPLPEMELWWVSIGRDNVELLADKWVGWCTQDKSSTASTMKIQALVLLRVILAASFAQTLEPHIRTLSKPLLDVLQERYYKVGMIVQETVCIMMRSPVRFREPEYTIPQNSASVLRCSQGICSESFTS